MLNRLRTPWPLAVLSAMTLPDICAGGLPTPSPSAPPPCVGGEVGEKPDNMPEIPWPAGMDIETALLPILPHVLVDRSPNSNESCSS